MYNIYISLRRTTKITNLGYIVKSYLKNLGRDYVELKNRAALFFSVKKVKSPPSLTSTRYITHFLLNKLFLTGRETSIDKLCNFLSVPHYHETTSTDCGLSQNGNMELRNERLYSLGNETTAAPVGATIAILRRFGLKIFLYKTINKQKPEYFLLDLSSYSYIC